MGCGGEGGWDWRGAPRFLPLLTAGLGFSPTPPRPVTPGRPSEPGAREEAGRGTLWEVQAPGGPAAEGKRP